MKLFLFGGAELGQVVPEIKLIGQVINQIKPKQVLHIPFARTKPSSIWNGDWFNEHIRLEGATYLNANREADMAKADNPLVFINGGSEHVNLYNKIIVNPRLLQLIKNAEYIVGESAGSMVLGEYQKSGSFDGPTRMMKGLGLIHDTIITPHYTERSLQELMLRGMKETGVKYGVGIDCMTAMEFELDEFPKVYKKIGEGSIFIETAV